MIDILVAAGRVPNIDGIGLEKSGVEVDDRGYTTAAVIWAIGEALAARISHTSRSMTSASSRTTWRAESAVAVLRAEATDETQGFMKVLVDANDDRILGFT